MTTLHQSWFYVLIPIIVTILGGIVAVMRTISPTAQRAVQHFTAGVVFAALAGEAIPDVIHRHALMQTVLGFILGVALMLILERVLEGHQVSSDERKGIPWGLLIPLAIDALLDGLVIGIGLTAGVTVGVLITVALSLEMFFLGLTVATALREQGKGRGWIVSVTTFAALFIGVGAVLGLTVLGGLSSSTLAGLLAFGCAALLYLVMEELLVEAHKEAEPHWMSSLFFGGFLLLLVIEMML